MEGATPLALRMHTQALELQRRLGPSPGPHPHQQPEEDVLGVLEDWLGVPHPGAERQEPVVGVADIPAIEFSPPPAEFFRPMVRAEQAWMPCSRACLTVVERINCFDEL